MSICSVFFEILIFPRSLFSLSPRRLLTRSANCGGNELCRRWEAAGRESYAPQMLIDHGTIPSYQRPLPQPTTPTPGTPGETSPRRLLPKLSDSNTGRPWDGRRFDLILIWSSATKSRWSMSNWTLRKTLQFLRSRQRVPTRTWSTPDMSVPVLEYQVHRWLSGRWYQVPATVREWPLAKSRSLDPLSVRTPLPWGPTAASKPARNEPTTAVSVYFALKSPSTSWVSPSGNASKTVSVRNSLCRLHLPHLWGHRLRPRPRRQLNALTVGSSACLFTYKKYC